MLVKIGASLSVTAQYFQRRGETYQFYMRIPAHLHKHYGGRMLSTFQKKQLKLDFFRCCWAFCKRDRFPV
jgi:hypothetical protein